MSDPKRPKPKPSHPWRAFNPGSLQSHWKTTPDKGPFKAGTTRKNRHQ